MKKTEYPRSTTRDMCAYYKKQERKADNAMSESYWMGLHQASKDAERNMRGLKFAQTTDH